MDENLTYGEVLTPHLMQKKFLITPHSLNHNRAARNIFCLFDNHLDGKNSEVFSWATRPCCRGSVSCYHPYRPHPENAALRPVWGTRILDCRRREQVCGGLSE